MSVESALRFLVRVLPLCLPAIRDAVAAGEVNSSAVRSAFDRVNTSHRWATTPAEMTAAAYQLTQREASMMVDDDGEISFTLFAAYQETPTSLIVSIRPNPGFPGAYVVEAQCPYAHMHRHRAKGHSVHSYGWPSGYEPDLHGSLGTRVPHCDGDTTSSDSLPPVELMLPAEWPSMVTS